MANVIHLAGPIDYLDGYKAAEAGIKPGHLCEKVPGAKTVRKNTSATNVAEILVALTDRAANVDIDTAYASGSFVRLAQFRRGSAFQGRIASGQDIALHDGMQSAGDGTLKEATSAAAGDNVKIFQAINAPGAVTVETLCKVEVIA